MSISILDDLIESQHQLLAALDSRDVTAIERATENLARDLAIAKSADVWPDQTMPRTKLEYAMKQADAAQTRVNYLADWNCQKIEKLAALRGQSSTTTYPRSLFSGLFKPK
jgi:hypothetical protein